MDTLKAHLAPKKLTGLPIFFRSLSENVAKLHIFALGPKMIKKMYEIFSKNSFSKKFFCTSGRPYRQACQKFFASRPEFFRSISSKVFKKNYSSSTPKCYYGHVDRSFDNCSEKLSTKNQNIYAYCTKTISKYVFSTKLFISLKLF